MLPADPRILFQVVGVVLGALVLWVIFVVVRLPTRAAVEGKVVPPVEKIAHEDEDEDAE